MDTEFTAEEAKLAADACASEIYHALCHTAVFEPDMLPDLLQGCLKSVFFGIRAKHFAQTGEFVNSRAQLLNLASDDEQCSCKPTTKTHRWMTKSLQTDCFDGPTTN
mgnify:CR=1 FL=1